jgi:hypothetical protein
MHVRIDEGRSEQEACSLDHAVGVRVEVRSERGDDALVDADVRDRVDSLDRIDDARATHEEILFGP